MTKKKNTSSLLIGLVALSLATPAVAERGETSVSGRLVVADECLLSDMDGLSGELAQRQEGLGALLLPILSGIAGDLAGSAVEGLAGAIQEASREHAYTAAGSDGFLAGEISPADRAVATRWSFTAEKKCLMFHVPGDREAADPNTMFVTEARSHRLIVNTDVAEADLIAGLPRAGIGPLAPSVYVEVALIPEGDAYFLRPMLVWYREALSGAGSRSRPTEMTVSLATPSYQNDGDALGTLFALARFHLPRMRPGEAPYRMEELAGLSSSYVPVRPQAGTIASRVNAANAVDAAVVTASTALLASQRTLEAARVKLSETNDAENRAAFVVARDGALDAQRTYDLAIARQGELQSQTVGTTNARVSFIVIRDANRFGLAIASALGAQKDAVDQAVSSAVAGQAPWRQLDTAYLTKMLEVQTKQAAYDAALLEEDPAAILAARNELLIAKANANEAAIAAGEDPPFPDLLTEAVSGGS